MAWRAIVARQAFSFLEIDEMKIPKKDDEVVGWVGACVILGLMQLAIILTAVAGIYSLFAKR